MESHTVLGATTFIYLLATFFYITHSVFRAKWAGIAGIATVCLGIVANSVGMLLRWQDSHQQGIGYIPLSNMYESLVFFALCIAVLYVFIERTYNKKIFGAYIVPFTFLAMAYASYSTEFGKEIKPLLPALQSNWLAAHVITCFIGYAAFAVSFAMALFYLFRRKGSREEPVGEEGWERDTAPTLKMIDSVIYRMMVFGFIWLTAGIITGAVWANSAWGTYWSWDPKETWSLITWFVYALALHGRFTRGWGGTRLSIVSLVGFVSVIFTYYGVNFLLSGLHSYGS
jgi:cytochrome c-type biogenesis protein CcsB